MLKKNKQVLQTKMYFVCKSPLCGSTLKFVRSADSSTNIETRQGNPQCVANIWIFKYIYFLKYTQLYSFVPIFVPFNPNGPELLEALKLQGGRAKCPPLLTSQC